VVSDGTRLDKELIDTDKTNDITARTIRDGLNSTTHHKNGTLDRLDVKIFLLSRSVVSTHDTNLLTSADGTREHTTKGIETTLIRSGYHLADVHQKRALRIASLNRLGDLIVLWTSVKRTATISLCKSRRRKVDAHHLEQAISSREPLTHDGLKEGLTHLLLLFSLEGDTKSSAHLESLLTVVLHDSTAHLGDGLIDELAESTLEGLAVLTNSGVLPLLGLSIEEVITPELVHHLLLLGTKLGGVHLGELVKSEGPALKTRTESNGTSLRGNLKITESLITISGDNYVDRLDSTAEVLISFLRVFLKLKKKTIDLVEQKDGLHTLTKSLTKHSLSLHTNTFDTIDDNKSTISNTKSSSNLRTEIYVTWRIDKVDKELATISTSRKRNMILKFVIHGDSSRLDSDTTLLFIGTCIHEASVTSLLTGNDTCLAHDGIGHGGLTVIYVSNHRHVTDVGLVVHHLTNLVNSEINHLCRI